MALQIPEIVIDAIRQLLKYDDQKSEILLKLLKSSPPALLPMNLAKQFASEGGISVREATSVVRSLMSLFSIRVERRVPMDQFLGELYDSIQLAGIKPTEEEWLNLKRFLLEVLNLTGAVEITSRAWDILLGNERNFIAGKIFTDLRPIFKADPGEPPVGAVIVHTLKVEVNKDNKRREIFIALDSSDLQKLGQTIERAKIKEASLLAFASESKLTVVRPEE
jgi:hypothetical protein